MDSVEKINCTRLPAEDFQIHAIYWRETPPHDIEMFTRMLQPEAFNHLRITTTFTTTQAADFSCEEMLDLLKANPSQVNMILFDETAVAQQALFAYQYNLTFHNSPNILIFPGDRTAAETLVRQYPSFDLCIYQQDYALLSQLLASIRGRTYDDQPIDLSHYEHLTHKNKQ